MDELVLSKKGKIFTESQIVAKTFDRNHKSVLATIRDIEKTCSSEFWGLNFKPSNYSSRGKKLTNYQLTRDGFTILAMGFTGEKAMEFKEMYIKRFNDMERFIISERLAKMEHKDLTNNIQMMHDPAVFYHYSTELNMINVIVLGMNAKQFRKLNGIEEKGSIRPYLSADQIEGIEKLQKIDSGFVIAVPDYKERKAMLESYYKRVMEIPTTKQNKLIEVGENNG